MHDRVGRRSTEVLLKLSGVPFLGGFAAQLAPVVVIRLVLALRSFLHPVCIPSLLYRHILSDSMRRDLNLFGKLVVVCVDDRHVEVAVARREKTVVNRPESGQSRVLWDFLVNFTAIGCNYRKEVALVARLMESFRLTMKLVLPQSVKNVLLLSGL